MGQKIALTLQYLFQSINVRDPEESAAIVRKVMSNFDDEADIITVLADCEPYHLKAFGFSYSTNQQIIEKAREMLRGLSDVGHKPKQYKGMDATTKQEFARLLSQLPGMNEICQREALLEAARFDQGIKGVISFALPAVPFFLSLISTMEGYMHFADGRHPVLALLEAAKVWGGPSMEDAIDQLLDKITAV